MKTKLVALFAIAFMTACEPIEQPPIKKTVADERFQFVEIDGCEYVMSHVYMGNSLTHKGNCKNPIHDCKSSGLH